MEKAASDNIHCLPLANADARDLPVPVPAGVGTALQAHKPSWVLYRLLNLWGLDIFMEVQIRVMWKELTEGHRAILPPNQLSHAVHTGL